MRISVPDYMFSGISEITPEFLKSIGVKALLCDIDNTLVTYDDPTPTKEALAFINEMTEAGIKIAFVSNNDENRVSTFNKDLGFAAFPNAKKPIPSNAKKAMEALGQLKNTELHSSVILSPVDVATFRKLGVNLTCEPMYQTKKLYHG